MPTIVIEPKMDIDLHPQGDADDCYHERKEVARVRVMERARDLGEMIGWLQFVPYEEGGNYGEYQLPWATHCPDLGDWLEERSGVDRLDWSSIVAPEEVWKAVIAHFV